LNQDGHAPVPAFIRSGAPNKKRHLSGGCFSVFHSGEICYPSQFDTLISGDIGMGARHRPPYQ
jgi:hypothetical protein